MEASGPVQHGGDATNRAPVKVAGRTSTSLPSALADGKVADVLLDAYGRPRVVLENAAGDPVGFVETESGNWTTSSMPKHTVIPDGSVLRFAKGTGYGSLGIVKVDESLYVYLSTADDDSAGRTQLFKLNSDGNIFLTGAAALYGGVIFDPTGTSLVATTVATAINELSARDNRVNATASPTAAENTAAGYPNGSLWTEVDADKLWVKVSESAGTAVWKYTTLT